MNLCVSLWTKTSGDIPQEHGPLLICFSKKEKVVVVLLMCLYDCMHTYLGAGGCTSMQRPEEEGRGLPLSFST